MSTETPANQPPKAASTRFTHVGAKIVMGSEEVARARSLTMAKRIANALNHYVPGPKGY